MHFSTRMKAAMALGLAGIFGGIAPLFMKIAFKEFLPLEITFLRYFFGILFFIPYMVLSWKQVVKKEDLPVILLSSLLYMGNIFLFIFGIQYTTSTVSQLFYLLSPVFVSIISFFLFREVLSSRRTVSIIFGIVGASLIIFRSVQGTLLSSIGSLQGNSMIIIGVIFWSLYIILCKKKGTNIGASTFIVWNFALCIIVSFIALTLIGRDPFLLFVKLTKVNLSVSLSVIALGVVNSGAMVFLYQWAIKNTSSFVVSSATYLSPLSAGIFAIPFMGEKLSITLIISALCIGVASYFVISEKRRKGINVV